MESVWRTIPIRLRRQSRNQRNRLPYRPEAPVCAAQSTRTADAADAAGMFQLGPTYGNRNVRLTGGMGTAATSTRCSRGSRIVFHKVFPQPVPQTVIPAIAATGALWLIITDMSIQPALSCPAGHPAADVSKAHRLFPHRRNGRLHGLGSSVLRSLVGCACNPIPLRRNHFMQTWLRNASLSRNAMPATCPRQCPWSCRSIPRQVALARIGVARWSIDVNADWLSPMSAVLLGAMVCRRRYRPA